MLTVRAQTLELSRLLAEVEPSSHVFFSAIGNADRLPPMREILELWRWVVQWRARRLRAAVSSEGGTWAQLMDLLHALILLPWVLALPCSAALVRAFPRELRAWLAQRDVERAHYRLELEAWRRSRPTRREVTSYCAQLEAARSARPLPVRQADSAHLN